MGDSRTDYPRGWYFDAAHDLDFFWGGTQWASYKGQYLAEPHRSGDPAFRPEPIPKKFGDGKPIREGQPIPPERPGMSSDGSFHGVHASDPVDAEVAGASGETNYPLKRLSEKEERVLAEHSPAGERPWLVINPGAGAGFLAAFSSELIIAKTSLAAGLMAGTLGGRRVTTFPYKQITGIEYNAGMISGVLEILTASYQGSENKDFWRGTNKSRNANSNDPFTLSNTLPLAKLDHGKAASAIQELKARVNAAHEVKVSIEATAVASTTSMADELQKLAGLKEQGLLTDEEFAAAKARLIQGS